MIILIVYYSRITASEWSELNTVVVPKGEEKCIISLSDPTNDVSNLECCVVGGSITSNRYHPTLDMVISNVSQRGYLTVCKGFCEQGLVDNDDTRCVNSIGQVKFEECVAVTKPVDCIGKSIPVGYSGITYYYALNATNKSCLTTDTCPA